MRKEESERFSDTIKLYEEKIKAKWDEKQRKLRVEEFNKYGEYV